MNDTDMITPLETHGPPVHQTQTENNAPRVQILEPHVPVGLQTPRLGQTVGTLEDQEARVNALVQQALGNYMRSLDERFAKIPGVPPPIEREAIDGFEESPFSEEIARVDIPKKFHLPNMISYDGTTDPDEHVALYKQKLMTISVSKRDREAVMCKSFGTSLTGPALTWFMHLQHGSISSFADLVNAFKIQFASSRKLEKQSSDLYHVIQR